MVGMTTGVDLLRDAFNASCDALGRVLADISDSEFFWEPVAGCWTVHRRTEVHRPALMAAASG